MKKTPSYRNICWDRKDNGDLWEQVYANLDARTDSSRASVVKVKGHATSEDVALGLVSAADKFKINLSVVKSVIKSNQERLNLLTQRIHKILGSNIRNKKISFLGVTFKPNTDDMRDSTSLKMIPYLCKKGAKVNYYDPSGEKKEFRKIKNCNYRNNIKSNCNGADLVILLTEWDEFKSIDFKKIVKNSKFKLYDLRNLYSAEEMRKNKINYYSIGRPDTN